MGYSAFEDTELASKLTARRIGELAICGIATEFCVKQTVLDAMRYGWPVVVLTDLVRAVESQPGDGELAQAAMLGAGATMALSSAWLQHR
jgi:nicotinamidase/pyrazinamidase